METTILTTWPNAFSKNADRAKVPLATVIEEVRSGKYASLVAQLRAMLESGDVARYKRDKSHLPAFAAAGTFDRRHHTKCLLKHSGVLPIDIDDLTTAKLSALKARLYYDQFICYCFVSPSGNGIKCGIRIDPTRHLDGFFAAKTYFNITYGVEIDAACKDVSRLTFVSHDPQAFVKSGTAQLPINSAARLEAESYQVAGKPSRARMQTTPPFPLKAVGGKKGNTAPNAVAGRMVVDPTTLHWLLRGCVAMKIGSNNYKLHRLARRCAGLNSPPLTEAEKQIVFNAWHTASQTSGPGGTSVLQDSYDDYAGKFKCAFENIRNPCADVVGEEFQVIIVANGCYKMPAAAEMFQDQNWKLTVALADRLATRNGDRPFILSCGDLARVLGITRDNAGMILNGLIREDILRVNEKQAEFKARRFIFNYNLGRLGRL